jgi:hypothetical protein
MDRADIYMLLKNYRTRRRDDREVICSPPEDVLDASAINVRKRKPPEKQAAEIRRGEFETLH